MHHERALDLLFEVRGHFFPEYTWGEWAKRLSSLNLGVDSLLHRFDGGVSQDGAVTQGSRTPFTAALIPAHHQTFCNEFRRDFHQLAVVDASLDDQTAGLGDRSKTLVRILGTPEGMLHVEAFLLPQYLVPAIVCCAKASAVIGRGSLQVMIGKWRITMNTRIRYAVQRAPACHCQAMRRH